jgi:hypothetical protein
VTAGTALSLARLARHYGVTNREIFERLIAAADDKITAKLNPTSAAWDAYLKTT